MKITLMPKKFYGKLIYSPVDEISKKLVLLHRDRRIKNPHFTRSEVKLLKEIGIEIELVPYLDPDAAI